jgi:hypothetical protein
VSRKPLRLAFGRATLLHLFAQVVDAARREDDGGKADEKHKGNQLVELVVFVGAAVLEEEIEGIDPNKEHVDRDRKRQDRDEIALGLRHPSQPMTQLLRHFLLRVSVAAIRRSHTNLLFTHQNFRGDPTSRERSKR